MFVAVEQLHRRTIFKMNPSKAPSKGELTSKDISLKKFYLLGAKTCYNGKRCKGLKKKKEFLVMANKGNIKLRCS